MLPQFACIKFCEYSSTRYNSKHAPRPLAVARSRTPEANFFIGVITPGAIIPIGVRNSNQTISFSSFFRSVMTPIGATTPMGAITRIMTGM